MNLNTDISAPYKLLFKGITGKYIKMSTKARGVVFPAENLKKQWNDFQLIGVADELC